jgi:hypothetical protein
MKTFLKKISVALMALFAMVCCGLLMPKMAFADDETPPCTSILTFIDCDAAEGEGIKSTVRLFVNIISAGVYVAATIGIIWCGVLMITARDDPSQVAKARKRIIEIVIGLVAWVLIEVLIEFIVPGGDTMGIGAYGNIITYGNII